MAFGLVVVVEAVDVELFDEEVDDLESCSCTKSSSEKVLPTFGEVCG